ncbi:MAG TPA: TetR/AcrR family transcriptional regulator [bacterium]|nr:TetR/AcrR family transcriptional regulator [bacterium]
MTKKAVATARPDGRKEKGRKIREQILVAALELAGEQGSAALTARNLAERVGISKANLYHHFKNMAEIRTAAAIHFLDILKPTSFEEPYTDPHLFLSDLIAGVADFLRSNKKLNAGYGIIFSNEARVDPGFLRTIEKKVMGRKSFVREKIRAMMGLPADDPEIERILLALDIMREGVIVYIADTSMETARCREVWNTTVDILLERLEKIKI